MRNFTVRWRPQGSLHVLQARAFLGPYRAAVLDQELEEIRERLSALPESGAPVKTRRGWSLDVRKMILTRSPYHLYYRLDLEGKRVILFTLWHENRRPPRL